MIDEHEEGGARVGEGSMERRAHGEENGGGVLRACEGYVARSRALALALLVSPRHFQRGDEARGERTFVVSEWATGADLCRQLHEARGGGSMRRVAERLGCFHRYRRTALLAPSHAHAMTHDHR